MLPFSQSRCAIQINYLLNLDSLGFLINYVLSYLSMCLAPCTVAHRAPLSVEFFRQDYWSRLLFPTPGDLSEPGVKPASLMSPTLAGGFFTTSAT